jgi:quinoprotein glucose dehydrogenase
MRQLKQRAVAGGAAVILVGFVAATGTRPARGADATAAGGEVESAKPQAAVSPESELAAAAIRVPEGFTVAPVASEPQLANPVAFCFDPQGRIFVAETHRVHKGVEDNRHHMDWLDDDLAARTVEQRRDFMVRRMGDQIGNYTANSDLVRLLEDRDADGRYEHSSIFSTGYDNVEDGAAAGVMWLGDRLLFTCIPSLWELRDGDGDGQAEHKKSLAEGFGVHVALFGHDMHGLTHGPDGKVYFSIGDRGLEVKTPEGRVLSNPDSGAVLRCNADGSDLELFATGLRNPQELAFNEHGDLFTVDNNSDSGDRARLVHIVEGMDAGWRMSYQYLPDRGPFNREKIWHTKNADQPASIVPPLTHLSDGPSGLVRYPGTGMPAGHEGAFFLADFRGAAGSSGVREFWVEPVGATYRLAKDAMFAEGILATDCDFGPDGALYISDWIDGWGGTGKGRIHRVLPGDADSAEQRRATQELLKRLAQSEAAELLTLMGHADMRVRLAAQRQLVARGELSSTPLVQRASTPGDNLLARLHAIWAIGELSESDPTLLDQLAKLCADSEPEVRAQAAKALGRGATADNSLCHAWGAGLVPLLADASPRVRAFTAISLGKLAHSDALAGLLKMARENADEDPVLRHAAAVGLAGSQTPESLLAAAQGAGESERLAIAVALGRQKSPLAAELLNDDAEKVRTEAARAIWDAPISAAYEPLAEVLPCVSSSNEPMLRRALAANAALGAADNLEAAIACGLQSSLGHAMREHAWQLIHDWAAPSPRDPVHGLWRPLPPRSQDDAVATLRTALPKILEAGVHGGIGLVVAAELGVHEAHHPLASIVGNSAYSPELQARAIAALGVADESLLTQVIEAGLKSDEPEVRSAARQLLIQRFPDRAVEQLSQAVDSATMSERQAALTMLAKLDDPGAREVVGDWFTRLEQGGCPPQLQLEVLDAASQSTDSEVQQRYKTYIERNASDDPLAQYSSCLLGGDAELGRRIFEENTALACRRCHSPNAGEKLVGPNLADVGLRLKRRELLESIVKPNAKIADGFQTTVLQLDTGKVVSGILRSENDAHAVLVDPDGKEIVVDAATIEDRFEGLSAMPEDLVKQMTPRDLRNLVEYLSSLRTPPDASHGAAQE